MEESDGREDAAIERRLVGGEWRKDPTYGLFFVAPNLRPMRTDAFGKERMLFCRASTLTGEQCTCSPRSTGQGRLSCLRMRIEMLGLSMMKKNYVLRLCLSVETEFGMRILNRTSDLDGDTLTPQRISNEDVLGIQVNTREVQRGFAGTIAIEL